MSNRLTFLSHFVICLAICAGAFFAFMAGVPQRIWATDVSMMTSVIALIFVGTAAWLGRQSWVADDEYEVPNIEWGHLAERLCVMAGLAGTTIGLSLQAKALMSSGTASFGALSTSLYTTATGVAAAAMIAVMVFVVETGINRVRH